MKIFLKILAVIWMILWGICVFASFLSKETSYAPIFIVLMFMGLIPFFIGKKSLKMDASSNNNLKTSVQYVDGINVLIKDTICDLYLFNNNPDLLLIQATTNIKQNIQLPINKITNIGIFTETEIIECNKSVIGGSIVGGLLFGGLGAIIGGMSGLQSKKTRIAHNYLVINYINTSEVIQAMSFRLLTTTFNKDLNTMLNLIKCRIHPQAVCL